MDSSSSRLSSSKKEKYLSSSVHKRNEVRPCGKNEFIRNGKRYIRIITNNMVRELLIPSEQKNVHTAVFHNNEFEKLSEKKVSKLRNSFHI
jgi:hypothetical protein